MRQIVVYGLGRQGDVQSTERFVGLSATELRKIASGRLRSYHTVEAWEGSVRILALSRLAGDPSDAS